VGSTSVAAMPPPDHPVHELTRADARQIVVRATMLDAARPDDLMTVVERLRALPVEPTRAIAPSYDLVCWSRLEQTIDVAVDFVRTRGLDRGAGNDLRRRLRALPVGETDEQLGKDLTEVNKIIAKMKTFK